MEVIRKWYKSYNIWSHPYKNNEEELENGKFEITPFFLEFVSGFMKYQR